MHTLPARPARWFGRLVAAGTLLWLVLLAAVVSLPYVTASATRGDDLTRNTVRLALLYYAAAASLMIFLRPADWTARTAPGAAARWFWTLSWAAYLIHLGMAFHHYHHWSHAAAVEHTREVSGFGEGIYVSHFFTLAWTADVLFWWLLPGRYARRAPWVGRVLHAFMLFVIFNAMIVFETGPIRWAGVALVTELAVLWLWRRRTAA